VPPKIGENEFESPGQWFEYELKCLAGICETVKAEQNGFARVWSAKAVNFSARNFQKE